MTVDLYRLLSGAVRYRTENRRARARSVNGINIGGQLAIISFVIYRVPEGTRNGDLRHVAARAPASSSSGVRAAPRPRRCGADTTSYIRILWLRGTQSIIIGGMNGEGPARHLPRR